jgi:hypothetical protein
MDSDIKKINVMTIQTAIRAFDKDTKKKKSKSKKTTKKKL